MNNYALMLINGDGIPVDIESGVEYLKKAIEKGNTTSMRNLANFYFYGEKL